MKNLKDDVTRSSCLSFLDRIAEKNNDNGQNFSYLLVDGEIEPLLSKSFKRWVTHASQ